MKQTMNNTPKKERIFSYQFVVPFASDSAGFCLSYRKWVWRRERKKRNGIAIVSDPFLLGYLANNFVMFAIIICRDTIIKIYFLWRKSHLVGVKF